MNLRHLLIFKTVVDTGSFTKAAKQLFITQSGVSHAIRELEQQTNAVLFDRLSKAIILTPAGKLLLEKVIPILSLYHDLEKQIDVLEMSAPLKSCFKYYYCNLLVTKDSKTICKQLS